MMKIPKKTLVMIKDARVERRMQENKIREQEAKNAERAMIRQQITNY